MKKGVIIAILSGGLCFPALSQQEMGTSAGTQKCEIAELLCGNWYLETGIGTQLLFSGDASDLEFGKRLTPLLSLSAGKWFSPYWGLRLQGSAYSLNGFSSYKGLYTGDANENFIYGNQDPVRDHVTIRPDGSYRHYLRYMNLHADYRVSLFNLFGLAAKEKGDIIPSAGIGYFQTFNHKGMPANASMSGNFTLAGKYKLTDDLDINMEVQTAILPDAFDGRISGQRYECTLGVAIGVTWNLPRRKDYKKLSAVAAPLVRIVKDTVMIEKEVFVEKIITEESRQFSSFVLSAIRFGIGQYVPQAGQDILFVNIARFMRDNPAAKLRLSGFADAQTGTDAYNLTLSGMRAKEVCRILVDEYQIGREKLEVQGYGMNEQPYDINNWNRVVLVVPFFK